MEHSIYFIVSFWVGVSITVIPAILILFTKDIVRAAFLLMASLVGLAGIYLLLGAEFIAFIQILVYVGGILILILFGVMLTNRQPIILHNLKEHALLFPGAIATATLLGILCWVVIWTPWQTSKREISFTGKKTFIQDLNNKTLPPEIQKRLNKEKVSYSPQITLRVHKKDKMWSLDGLKKNDQVFILRKDKSFYIYKGFIPNRTSRSIGESMLTDFLFPFEIASVILLIALIGATYIGRQEKESN